MKNARYYYAQIDTTVSKANPGHGFANAKEARAFPTKGARDTFIAGRWYDMTCKAIKRADAIKLAYDMDGSGALSVTVVDGDCDSVVLVPSKF